MDFFTLRPAKTLFTVATIAALLSLCLTATARAQPAPAAKPVNPAVCLLVVIEYAFTADDRAAAHSSPAIWALSCPGVPVKLGAS